MSTQDDTDELGARLRSLRGEESQEAFSRRVGITRSALANYETGRTRPKPSVLRQICQKAGVPEKFLLTGEVTEFDELAAALGAYKEAGTLPGLTEDEKAIIRVLRLCSTRTSLAVVNAMISALEQQDFDKRLADLLTIEGDIKRLYLIKEVDGAYNRGLTPDTLAAITDILSKRRAGPQ